MLTAATVSEQTGTTQNFSVTNWCFLLLAKAVFMQLGQSPKEL